MPPFAHCVAWEHAATTAGETSDACDRPSDGRGKSRVGFDAGAALRERVGERCRADRCRGGGHVLRRLSSHGRQWCPAYRRHGGVGARAEQGLSTLTDHAINGIRQMPAHGNTPALTNDEIKRAVTTMVNRSGGRWVDPLDADQAKSSRSGAQIVQARCAKCHETGSGGAPRIGDRSAWAPRFSRGLDFLVKSAIHGHGAMPPGVASSTLPTRRSAPPSCTCSRRAQAAAAVTPR